jgi:hypothetical protein
MTAIKLHHGLKDKSSVTLESRSTKYGLIPPDIIQYQRVQSGLCPFRSSRELSRLLARKFHPGARSSGDLSGTERYQCVGEASPARLGGGCQEKQDEINRVSHGGQGTFGLKKHKIYTTQPFKSGYSSKMVAPRISTISSTPLNSVLSAMLAPDDTR